jgi:UDP-N-acetylmuramate--alanine ligase
MVNNKLSMELKAINKIYFIGIGGIGISAAAGILKQMGKEVGGSDMARNEVTEQLEQEGIKVFIPQQEKNISSEIDLVVYSVAVPEDNPERQKARELGLTELSYPQLLGEMTKNKHGIGVSGTNGKTTVTAMLGKIFLETGLDPTVVVGSKVDYLKGNSRLGRSKYFIFESDEYRRAFANYRPQTAVVTYIAADHLDCYRDLAEIKAAFGDYLDRVAADGLVVLNSDDKNSLEAVQNIRARKVYFGIEVAADYLAKEIRVENGEQKFLVEEKGGSTEKMKIKLPGKFNVYNALAAIATARSEGVGWPVIKKVLAEFNGAWRRFQKTGILEGADIIADYAHTPDAVSKTILAAKEFYPNKKILAVFQPHQYNRTKKFFEEFAQSFAAADLAIISDIFFVRGRENPDDFDVSSRKLAAAIKDNGVNAIWGGGLKQTENLIRQTVKDFEVILILGAGDIYEAAKNLVK